ncbi:hypothetical protein [Sphaerisporangium sp. TRM90804]|uniref:hypothetical protein n=1 Tax=Sphaerisporangium sp. TRM90804 TaxID=3031113 RepID=UPI0024479DB3|nr:hypothetical protein [Sphaerisporangium sp. TRM90804]MDH2425763.1 hypothetical protein [Sphaerisporangium sp. TRM90804]
MYEIRDDLNNVLASRPTVAEAEAAVDDLCRQAHAQAAATSEGTTELWLHLRVVDEHGAEVMFRDYNPNPTEPYEPLGDA